jgi:hypothetical protein
MGGRSYEFDSSFVRLMSGDPPIKAGRKELMNVDDAVGKLV